MYAKNNYCVQVRSNKGWRYFCKYTKDLDFIVNTYMKALEKHKQARILNSTEYGVRVSKISMKGAK